MAGQMVHYEIPSGDAAKAQEFWVVSSDGSSRSSPALRAATT